MIMNLIKARKIFFQEINYLVLITILYYGALRIHEADKDLIWHKLDTLALIALFVFPIPYILFLLKYIYFLTKKENRDYVFQRIKIRIAKTKILLQQGLKKTKEETLLTTIINRTLLILFGVSALGCLIQIYVSLVLLITNIAKLLPH
ncbi:unnamed protein product [Commensalibacter papalotli (ex Botero et al. 2024)]|uniref:RDD domain-containing protein n=2 Tax=Commensalibacter papalotli (ex Botero et al. 2024) TaxID=2972766 RepID=A0ABM9HSF7_9PROT|nr:unnamed protein product [Commensalibacter papalotli (ex Botero et al. 2024)]CAI3958489.1 unnamed protein product [Commensalibacter papalotli (ex Botero et al. 2024)]